MDGDPAVEPVLDTFSLILPLPYRIAVISVLGELGRRGERHGTQTKQVYGHGQLTYTCCRFARS